MPWKNAQKLNDDRRRDYGLVVVIAMVGGERFEDSGDAGGVR